MKLCNCFKPVCDDLLQAPGKAAAEKSNTNRKSGRAGVEHQPACVYDCSSYSIRSAGYQLSPPTNGRHADDDVTGSDVVVHDAVGVHDGMTCCTLNESASQLLYQPYIGSVV